MPAILVVMYVAFFLALFTSIPTRSTTSIAPSFVGLIIAFGVIGVVSFAGLIMFFVSMHRLSRYYSEPNIFTNVLYALILNIVGGITIVIALFGFLFASLGNFITSATGTAAFTAVLAQFFVILAVVLLVSLALGLVSGVLYMRTFNKLAEKSGVDNFRTAGILYLVGVIVPVVGWIAWIFAYMSFGILKPTTPATSNAYPQASSSSLPSKFCPNCRAENSVDSLYCRNCGKPI
jgi:uncharacterized membrane protein